MKTMTTQMGKRSIALAVAVACVTALPVHAEETVTIRQSASKQESVGVVTGLAVGAVAGGPVGAIVGAAAGAWLGDRYHKQAVARNELAAGLSKSEGDRTRLAQNVSELNGSLAHEQERGEQLDLALSHTDEVQTDDVGASNHFTQQQDSGQPTSFAPGRHDNILVVPWDGTSNLQWHLGKSRAEALTTQTCASNPVPITGTGLSSLVGIALLAVVGVALDHFLRRRRSRSTNS